MLKFYHAPGGSFNHTFIVIRYFFIMRLFAVVVFAVAYMIFGSSDPKNAIEAKNIAVFRRFVIIFSDKR